MVQVIKGGTEELEAKERIGYAQGKSLSNFLNNYAADRSLENVLKNPEYKEKPLSEKMNAIESAMRPYGDTGRQMFENRLKTAAIEQKENEAQQRRNQSRIIGRALSGEKVSTKEMSELPENVQIQLAKIKQPQEPRPEPSFKRTEPVNPEYVNRAEEIVRRNPTASPEQLEIDMGKAGIPPSYSDTYVENRRRQAQNLTKLEVEKNKETSRERNTIHKESKKEDAEITQKAISAKNAQVASKEIRRKVNSGNLSPLSIANIFGKLPIVGDKISRMFTSHDQSTIKASVPYLLEGWKDIFGVRLSDADLKLLEDKLPNIGNSKDANLAILDVIDKYTDYSLLREKISNQIKKENTGFRPINFASQVEERFDNQVAPVRMEAPNGQIYEIPKFRVPDAEKSGGKLLDEYYE